MMSNRPRKNGQASRRAREASREDVGTHLMMRRAPALSIHGRTHRVVIAAIVVTFLVALAIPGRADDSPTSSAGAAKKPAPAATTSGPTAQPTPSPTSDELSRVIDGYVQERAKLRHAGSESDLDLYTDVYLDMNLGGKHDVKARLNGEIVADVLGNQHRTDYLRDIWDGLHQQVHVQLYEAWAQAKSSTDFPVTVRAGRQFVQESTFLEFDGARADAGPFENLKHLRLTVFGGIPVRFGEPNRDSNWMAGAVCYLSVDPRTRVRAEYVHVTEDVGAINDPVIDPAFQPVSAPAGTLNDDLAALSAWRRLGREFHLFGRFSVLNGHANELELRGRWASLDGRWNVVSDFHEAFKRLDRVTNDLSPFVPMLGALEPYWRLSIRATRRIGEEWVLQGGYSHRALIHGAREAAFNHDYDHYYVSATRLGLLDRKLDAALTGIGYTSKRNDVGAFGGSLDYRATTKLTLSAGMDYSLYKYDFLRDTELEDVWGYWCRARVKLDKKTIFSGEVRIDDDRYTTYFTFEASIQVRF